MSKIVFTICSNNYLAQAKALGDSVTRNNPDYQFMIFLCDKKSSAIDYSFFKPYSIIEAHDIGIKKFKQMVSQYNIIELNTSIKPFVFDYILKNDSQAQYVMYFDPDTYAFDKLTVIEDELKNKSILLTPHIYTPIEFDGLTPTENTFTQHGIYNLGFAAIKRSEDAQKMIGWWMRRLEVNCYIRSDEGIFVDQMPMNFVPIFFKNVKISENWGLNMAPWNLHERDLTIKDGKYFVNNETPLCFYHFSNCNPNNKELLATHYNRVSFEGHNVLRKAYDDYKAEVLNNKYNELSQVDCFYSKHTPKPRKDANFSTLKKVTRYLKKYPLFLFRKDFWI